MTSQITPLRVWHLSSNRWNSAITEYALSSVRALENMNCACTFSPLAGSPAALRAQQLRLPQRPVAGFGATQYFALRRLARELRPDVVLTYGGPETVLAASLGLPVVRFKGESFGARAPRSFALSQRFVRAYICPNAGIVAELRNAGVPQAHLSRVPLGIATEQAQVLPGGLQRTRPELLIVGRLDPVKGHAPFLLAFAHLLARWTEAQLGPRPYLSIIGESANIAVADLQALCKRVGLQVDRDVYFETRRVDNVFERMARATLGIIPSVGSEQICRVGAEFLVCGTPIFTTTVGGLTELLFEGAGACYEPNQSAEAVAERLQGLVQQFNGEPQAVRIARAQGAMQRFSLTTMGQILRGSLDAALAPARAAR